MSKASELGKRGEDIACEFLEAKGYNILDRNYRFEKAEIDIAALMLEPAELIFVEVKTRSGAFAHRPEESVSAQKQQHIFRAADAYLYEKGMASVPVRFDIIAIQILANGEPVIHHIEDAFRMF